MAEKDIEALLEMDIEYLAVFPRDEKILPEILTKAEKKKVPVILITKNLCYRNRCAALISIDYELEGQLAARVLAENSKGEDCNIVEIKGPEGVLRLPRQDPEDSEGNLLNIPI